MSPGSLGAIPRESPRLARGSGPGQGWASATGPAEHASSIHAHASVYTLRAEWKCDLTGVVQPGAGRRVGNAQRLCDLGETFPLLEPQLPVLSRKVLSNVDFCKCTQATPGHHPGPREDPPVVGATANSTILRLTPPEASRWSLGHMSFREHVPVSSFSG